MSLGREAAMNAELRSSARRTGCASARRELCLTERTQQCQGGPKAWNRDLYDQGESDACRQGNVVARVGGTARARAGSTARAAGKGLARAGSTARAELHRPIVRVLAVHNDGGVLRYQA